MSERVTPDDDRAADDDPALDAEVIAVADEGYRRLGITGHRIELTSLGDSTCRPAYRAKLQEFLRGLPLNGFTRNIDSLVAVSAITDGRDALYFLHARDGKIYVNHTYAEHLRDNERYR